ncbi:MAG: amino acid ABC transporter permease [Gammaproteobacteria bacterium]|nr:amino acid ABC transporter permease [Gammaproteobacteria bacterium]
MWRSIYVYAWCLTLLSPGVLAQSQSQTQPLTIGSKLYTENVLLGHLAAQSLEEAGYSTFHNEQLGGTRILWNALLSGGIDVYPDYTGTITEEILAGQGISSRQDMVTALSAVGVGVTGNIGFNNTYALGMRREQAEALGIETISDLRAHTDLRFGFSNEFMERQDGWPGVRAEYGLAPLSVTGLDHALAYRGIASGNIDVLDLYSTDPEIAFYDLVALIDDQQFFPDYDAVFLYRDTLSPAAAAALERFTGAIDETAMIAMNAAVKLDQRDDAMVAGDFMSSRFGVVSEPSSSGLWPRFVQNTLDHLTLVSISLGMAILVAIPMGVLAAKVRSLESVLLGISSVLQTIPSLALLVLMIPLFGIGALPAIVAMFLYSLLPIVRNTHAGIRQIPATVMESAWALGLPNSLILRRIELPMAIPSILSGIKISAVMNVGVATLGALIGAGGYGQPILTGIRLDNTALILEGAIPAAVLALLVQGFFDRVEKRIR